MNLLTFDKRTQAEKKAPRGTSRNMSGSTFDFIISGQSLKVKLNSDHLDLISPFGWGAGQAKSKIPGSRVMLYVCAECGDISCDAITADTEITTEKVIWKNYTDTDIEQYKHIVPMKSDKTDYLIKFKEITHKA